MHKSMLPFIILLTGLLAVYNVNAQTDQVAASLDDLLATVVQGKNADSKINKQRLDRFRKAHDDQQRLLATAKSRTVYLEQKGEQLNRKIADNDRQIGVLESQLSERLGNFGELFGVTRQVAGDTRAQIKNSLISAQFPGRDIALDKIATSKTLPTVDQLRLLWITLLQEQTQQGKIARFNSFVGDEEGIPKNRDIIRLGPFAAISDKKYLSYQPESERLINLVKQPASRYEKSAKRLTNAEPGKLVSVAIDPSRGTILNLLVQTPGLFDRFKQGGLPGYVVSTLALIGFVISILRLLDLWQTSIRVQQQTENKNININNPLGRVLNAYEESPNLDIEALELKLDDVILKEIPKLDRGLSTIKVLAAVAPLIGLLGTVIGMILTFQAITLWGTGEPKIMAGGISQALVTTVQGLIAAIPLLLLHNITNGRARFIQQILEEQSAGLIARRAEQVHE